MRKRNVSKTVGTTGEAERRYSITIAPAALKALQGLARGLRDRVAEHIRPLASNPRPPGCKMLSGGTGEHRIRVGDVRVLYRISDGERAVFITAIRPRDKAYR